MNKIARGILCRIVGRHEWAVTFSDKAGHRDRTCPHCGKGQHTVNQLNGIVLWQGGTYWKLLKKEYPDLYKAAL